ncbi:glycosyltransferase family 2 protein [Actinomadura roseirufa]|uniref:glycosyltransferase family 2 protein n=1 Tax=Actinomadura roseirufa TaxID=2094049 RepID=UPI001A955FEA|nr:glycosyltransferase [Actinomadura roseirufa]
MTAPMTTAAPPRPAAAPALLPEPPEDLSARRLLSRGQAAVGGATAVFAAAALGVHALTGAGPSFTWWAQAVIAFCTAVYALVVGFKLLMVLGSWEAPVLRFGPDDLRSVPNGELPAYTVLVPLYKEAEVLPHLLDRLGRLDYPADRLQVLLLVEQDDTETRDALPPELPGSFEVVLIPPSAPRTKPKACNVGLAHARGEFVVVYDAEDRPSTGQLREAVLAFRALPDRVVCVQAELQYWNPWTNWLTRCFAAEYATNFSLVLRGLDRHRLPIPLGGTSNHFRAAALRDLGAWDPYNVTEDADLGIRIARRGWDVRMMDSVTEEEANSRLGNWIRQRSRWIKGHIQTWLVHTRHPVRLWRELGTRGTVAFHLTMGFSTFAALANPLFWALTLIYLFTGVQFIGVLFPAATLYTGVATMAGGNLLMAYCMMTGCLERDLHRAVRTMLTAPLYWALMSVAACKAVAQLLRPSRRHFWELTDHGLVNDPPPG